MNRACIVAAALLAGSCSSGAQYSQAIVALVDVSGTYADQKPEVVNVIRKGVLPRLTPGDTLVVIRIDSESYKQANVESGWTRDMRPSKPNAQRRQRTGTLDPFSHKPYRSTHTDI